MAERIHQHRKWLAFGAIVLVLTIPCLLGTSWASRKDSTDDDGWRRTDRGWERVATWNQPAMATTTVPFFHSPRPVPAKTSPRWDTHPAVLAFAQLAAVFVALLALPDGSRISGAKFFAHLPALVAKSFRASPFG